VFAAAALILPAATATSELSIRRPAGLPEGAVTQWPELISTQPLSVECWQEGVKIIAERDLHGISVNDLLQREAVSFRRQNENYPSVHVVALHDSTCLIRTQPDEVSR
jgi:hypothetical protein